MRMNIKDLGQRDDRLLLFGGPYSNLQALKSLVEDAQRLRISADHMVCTGDVVAYGADPTETVAMIRALRCPIIAGNCEKQLGDRCDNCGCGFEEGSTCDVLSAGWYAHADKCIADEDRAWMRNLPDIATITHHKKRYAVIHGGMSDISRFIWPTCSDLVFEEEISLIRDTIGDVDGVIAGHNGIAFIRNVNGITWINAGVIGMPSNEGRVTTQYVVMENGQAEIKSLSYDHHAAYEAMQTTGLTQGYHKALLSGYWPSEDVLPPELRRADTASG